MSKSNHQTLSDNATGYQDSIVLNINLPKEEKKEFKLFKLPTISKIFGREDDYQKYKEMIQEDNKLLLSTAIGGVGKTDFSIYFARQALKEGLIDRAIFLNVGATRVSPANPVFSLKEILINEVKEFFPNIANNDCLEIVSDNLLEIKESQQRNLLILDDVSSDWLLEAENQTALDKYFGEDWYVLATSRDATDDEYVDNFKVLKLGFLSPEASRQLFLKNHPKAKEEGQALEEILAKLSGHALLVDLVSRATHSQRRVQSLQDFNTGLDQILKEIGEQEINRFSPNNDRTVMGILEYTFDFVNLDPEEQAVLKYFSLLPSQEISIGILVDLFKKVFIKGLTQSLLDLKELKKVDLASHLKILEDEKSLTIIQDLLVNEFDVNRLDLKILKTFVDEKLKKLSKKGWLDAGDKGYKAHNLIQVLAKEELKPEAGDYFQVGYALQQNNQFEFAEKNYQQALKLYRKLAEQSPQVYNPDVAMTLNNLANLQAGQGEFSEAEKNYKEALEIRRKLAEQSPEIYSPDVANTLNNLAILQAGQGEFSEAEKNYKEALEIRRKLAEQNSQVYSPDVAVTLNSLATLQKNQREFKEAEKNYKEALKLYRELAEQSPKIYGIDLATTIIAGVYFLNQDKSQLKEARNILEQFGHIPRAVGLLGMIDKLENQ